MVALKTGSVTGKSFSEAFILASVNPSYDNRLFIELRVQNMLCTKIVSNAKTKTNIQTWNQWLILSGKTMLYNYLTFWFKNKQVQTGLSRKMFILIFIKIEIFLYLDFTVFFLESTYIHYNRYPFQKFIGKNTSNCSRLIFFHGSN